MIQDEGGILTSTATVTLSGRDVCDSSASGAEEARVRLVQTGTANTLDLCGHHFSLYELRLTLEGWVVVHDIRDRDQAKPLAGSPGPIVGGNYGTWG